MFWLDDSLGSSIYLDGIITVVDALNIYRSLDNHDNTDHNLSTAHLQISHADAILVNKVDLVDNQTKVAVSDRIRSINGIAKLYETKYSRIPSLDEILDLHGYDDADFPIHNFNRDTSGHLDHVCPFRK
jgi:G3E family GTPase